MNKNKTLFIADLDGTLLNKSAKLSEYTINSLNTLISEGLDFSVATARLPGPVSKMLVDVKINVPVILMNGTLIYDIMKENYIKYHKLEHNIVDIVIKEMKKFKIAGFMYELKNEQLVIYHEIFDQKIVNDYINERINRYKSISPGNGLSSISSDNIIYFTLMDTYEELKPVYDALEKLPNINLAFYKNVYTENIWFLEVFSVKANKENAINYLRKTYGYEKVICFGDNTNDLPMFLASDIKVAVENAISEIKSIADYICDSNENDGVAKWLEENYSNTTKE